MGEIQLRLDAILRLGFCFGSVAGSVRLLPVPGALILWLLRVFCAGFVDFVPSAASPHAI